MDTINKTEHKLKHCQGKLTLLMEEDKKIAKIKTRGRRIFVNKANFNITGRK